MSRATCWTTRTSPASSRPRAEIGCGAVKFQLFKIDQMFAPEILAQSAKHRARREWELPVSFLGPIAERCKARGVQFICTPFYLKAVEELLPHVAAFNRSRVGKIPL